MEPLHTSTVTPTQIDHLGHMNVRFYTVLADAGARELMARLGLGGEGDPRMWARDIHVRHHREQLVGAHLEVSGGVLDAHPDRLRIYEELSNQASGELAATFVLGFTAVAGGDRHPVGFSETGLERARAQTVELPAHGRARSISFDDDPARAAPALAELRARDLAQREVRVLEPFECDEHGWYRSEMLVELVWGGTVLPGHGFQPFHSTADGRTMGWATMETRASWARLPRVGDRVQCFAAELDVGTKTMTSRHWVYDIDRAEVVCVFTIVNLAFDLESRRSILIPDALRQTLQKHLHPDLAGS